MTVKSSGDIIADINTYLPDNTTGDISPEDVRQRFLDLADSDPTLSLHSQTTSGALSIDFFKPAQNITLNGTVTSVSTVGKSSTLSKMTRIYLSGGASDRFITFSSDPTAHWKWIGTSPTGLPANRAGLLVLTCFGTAETNVVAAYELLGSGV